jgi:hypothetical protein
VKFIKESMICLGIMIFLKQNKEKLMNLYNDKQTFTNNIIKHIENILQEQLFEENSILCIIIILYCVSQQKKIILREKTIILYFVKKPIIVHICYISMIL